jgi:alkyl sulfatase BDS1-like metallo-beta-lactamase superfamily hydrolase
MREPERRTFASMLCCLSMGLAAVGWPTPATTAESSPPVPSKPATEATQAANAAVLRDLPFADRADFEDAQRGLIARPEKLTITDANGKVVWDLEAYKRFISLEAPAPDTVNPSLWRNAQLNMQYGLFKVTDRIYQVRGYDISNITFVQGDTGWIVFDPLISVETAKAAYELVSAHLGQKPVRAVVYSHSHVDHYGGVRALISQEDVAAGNVQILAPEGFIEHAISENVIAGNAMSRRAIYMFGALLPRNPRGGVNGGLGQTVSAGTVTLILPTDTVRKTGETRTIDGVEMVFQMTPGTEAPAEMNTWFPQFKAMWMAENTTNTLHNVLTLRGALVRDSLRWAGFIDETLDLYGPGTDVKFQSHHWPMWGNAKIVDYLKKQRDLYKYLHDQSVRLMNQGYVASEIAETLTFPPELDRYWPNRGYYGTLRHNARAVYQRYMGWYDGNPSDLNDLPPEPAAKKYLEYMGGEAAVLERARRDFANGEYRWVAMALKHVVFANPGSVDGKALLADAYEQLGYQAESGPWRSVYLQGALELRNGVPKGGGVATGSPDILAAMPPEMLFDYMAVRLNGPKAAGRKLTLNIDFTDLGKQYALTVENGVLNHAPALDEKADATLTIAKQQLDRIQLKQLTMEQALAAGTARLEGRRAAFGELMALLDDFPFWFNIVTP